MPYIVNDRIEDKLAEARADVAAGCVKPMDQVMNRLRSKFSMYTLEDSLSSENQANKL